MHRRHHCRASHSQQTVKCNRRKIKAETEWEERENERWTERASYGSRDGGSHIIRTIKLQNNLWERQTAGKLSQ